MLKFGHTPEKWDAAKCEATSAMIAAAKAESIITYSDLCRRIISIEFSPHDSSLHSLLGEISIEQNSSNYGMLSAVVVLKNGEKRPGAGFYTLAEELGRDTSDQLKLWVDELHKVYKHWSVNS